MIYLNEWMRNISFIIIILKRKPLKGEPYSGVFWAAEIIQKITAVDTWTLGGRQTIAVLSYFDLQSYSSSVRGEINWTTL